MQVLVTPQQYPDQIQRVQLGEATFGVRLVWRPYTEAWYLDLYDADDTAVLLGVRVEPGANLLLLADPAIAPDGALMAVQTGQIGDDGARSTVVCALTRPVVIAAGVNDDISFDETIGGGGGPFVATITPGTYYWLGDGSASDACKAVADALTAAGAWTYSGILTAGLLDLQSAGSQRYEIRTTDALTTVDPVVMGFDAAAVPPGIEPSDGSGQWIGVVDVSRWTLRRGHRFQDAAGVQWTPVTDSAEFSGVEVERYATLQSTSPGPFDLVAGVALTPVVPASPPVGVVTSYEAAAAGAYPSALDLDDMGTSLRLIFVPTSEL